MPKNTLPDWELVLSAAARLQRFVPDAVLVGGTASALYAKHRFSRDADHVLTDLRDRFDAVLADLESISGWQTARIQRPVQTGRFPVIECEVDFLSFGRYMTFHLAEHLTFEWARVSRVYCGTRQ